MQQSYRGVVALALAVGIAGAAATTVRTDQAAPVTVPGINRPVVVVTGDVGSN
jgi:hypothetical protein